MQPAVKTVAVLCLWQGCCQGEVRTGLATRHTSCGPIERVANSEVGTNLGNGATKGQSRGQYVCLCAKAWERLDEQLPDSALWWWEQCWPHQGALLTVKR